MPHKFVQFVVATLLLAVAARAQAQGRYVVEGKVTAKDGGPLSEATVRAEGVTAGATSGADGSYRLSVQLPPGDATIRAVYVRNASLRWPVPSNLADLITGQTVEAVERRARFLVDVHTESPGREDAYHSL